MNEKERVYQELDRTREKCFRLKKQIRAMHAAFDNSEIAVLRAEAEAYKRALSYIAHRLDEDETLSSDTLRSIVRAGLEHRMVRPGRRRLIRGDWSES